MFQTILWHRMGNGMVDTIVKVSTYPEPLLVNSTVLEENINGKIFGESIVKVVVKYELPWEKVDAMAADGASYVKRGFLDVSDMTYTCSYSLTRVANILCHNLCYALL